MVAIGDYKERFDRDVFEMRVVAACTEAFPTAGVYWGDASVVHSPKVFRKLAVTKIEKAEDVPAMPRVGFWREKHDDGSVSFYTKGLDRFGCMELRNRSLASQAERNLWLAPQHGPISDLRGQRNERRRHGWR